MSQMEINAILNDAYKRYKEPISVEDAAAMITGIDSRTVPEPAKKYTRKQMAERSAKNAAIKAEINRTDQIEDQPIVSDQVASGSVPEEIVEEPEKELQKEDEEYLLSKFPEGTVLNTDDQTLTLPDGRMIRKIPEV